MPRLTITVPDKVAQPYRFSLERQIVYFGRGDDNDIHIDSGSVSLEHCVMERIIGGYVLKDLGSTNGIKLDGTRVDKIHLRNGQSIQIGDVDFGFLLSDEEMTALRLEDPTSQLPPLDEPPIQKVAAPKELPQTVVQTVDLKSPPPSEAPMAEQKPKPEPLPELPPERQPDIRQLPDLQPQQQFVPQPQVEVMPQMAAAPSVDNGKFNKLIALAAAVSFITGVAMHFQNKTGQSLISAIIHKLSGDKEAK